MKKIVSLILSLLLLFSAVPVSFADDDIIIIDVCEGITVTIDKAASTLTVSGTGDMPDYNISNKPLWFGSPYAVNVFVEDGITSVGSYSFARNSATVRVVFGDSVKNIGSSAFSECKSITTVETPPELERIDSSAFSGCSSLASFYFPESVEYIGPNAFYNCTKLRSIELPQGIDLFYANAFTDTGYYKSLSTGINTVCGYTLEYKGTPGQTVNLPENTRVISARTLINSSTVRTVNIPDSVEAIMFEGLYNLTNLREITVPDSVAFFGDFCLGYKNGEDVLIPYPQTGFRIKGHGRTAAAEYASECGLDFECMCEDGVFTSYPDCLVGGTAVKGCKYCGRKLYTVEIEPGTSHTFGNTVSVPSTCTESGTVKKVCTLCGYTQILGTILPNGHTPITDDPRYVPPTCTERGKLYYICSACGEECNAVYFDPTGHTPSDSPFITAEPSCTEEGTSVTYCAVCGEVVDTEVIPPAGHRPSEEWRVLIPSDPANETMGFRVKQCTVCGVAVLYEYFLAGDVNGDGAVNLRDIVGLKKIISSNYEEDLIEDNADFNGDGKVGIMDLTALKRFFAG